MALAERHLRALLELVGDVAGVDDLAEFRTVLFAGLVELVRADYVSYNEVARSGEVLAGIVTPQMPRAAVTAWERHAHENPLLRRFEHTRDARPYRFSDVVTPRELEELELFRACYGPLGLRHQVAFVLPSGPAVTVAIALTRGGRDDFTAADVELLDLARPHLAQAYRNARQREHAAGTIAALLAGVEVSDQAIAVVEGGRLGAASSAALRVLERVAEGPVSSGSPLPAPLAAWWEGETPSDVGLPLVLFSAPGGPIIARRLPGRDGAADALVITHPVPAASAATLRGLGLSEREATVLGAFMRGGAPDGVARALGIKPRTVAKHAQSIYTKLGVRSRAEAVALGWSAGELAAVARSTP